MECCGKPVWTKYSREELRQLSITGPDETIRKCVQLNWDRIAKPIDGMGRFEKEISRIGAVLGTDVIHLRSKAVLIFCADNGIVEEGVSQTGQEVTAQVARSMGRQASSVCRMAAQIGADTIPVDIGMNSSEEIPGVLSCKIRHGTRNFRYEPAMTEEETVRAIAAGIHLVEKCRKRGYRILAAGEMGIGNTTTSSAVTAALLKVDVDKVTGRGAGLSAEGLRRKKQLIEEAIIRYNLRAADAFTILQTVGGLDIAGLAGMCMGGALYHIPIVLDGVISMAAALLAERMLPGTREFLLASHKGREPAMEVLAGELQLEPVIDGGLALGEGTGAVMMLSLLDMALCIYNSSATFSDIEVTQYQRIKN